MTNVKTPRRTTRRRFVASALVAGAATITGLSLLHSRRRAALESGFSPETPLVRNAAFSAQRSDGLILGTRTAKGERIAFRLDAQSRELWQSVCSPEEYQAGKRITARQLLDAVVRKHPEQDSRVVRREASDFLKAALEAGLIAKPGIRVCVVRRSKSSA